MEGIINTLGEPYVRITFCSVQWCKDWGVKIKEASSCVMHIRKKSERGSEHSTWWMVELPMVSFYKYLGLCLG